jgi:hypothetical protein
MIALALLVILNEVRGIERYCHFHDIQGTLLRYSAHNYMCWGKSYHKWGKWGNTQWTLWTLWTLYIV